MKREKLDIINSICEAISNIRNINPSNLMFKATLSLNMLKDYKKELIEKGFIKEIILLEGNVNGRYHKKESKTFELTNKGREYLEFYRKFTAFKEKYGLNEK